jgi:hypothetical protein
MSHTYPNLLSLFVVYSFYYFFTTMKSSSRKNKKSARRRTRQKRHEKNYNSMEENHFFSTMFIAMIAAISFHLLTYVPRCFYDSHRVRKDLEKDIFNQLGEYYLRRAYRMDKYTFYRLHHLLEPLLIKHFFPKEGGNRDIYNNPYLIKTEIRLSITLRYFAGASPYDLVVTHGVSMASVFYSIWGVVDCINKCPDLDIKFPDYNQQEGIARGFKKRSGASFDCVVGAIDGILIWILKPLFNECLLANCGEGSFNCSRKDKYGLNMQAICDDELRFLYIDLSWPGSTADYLAWITSSMCQEIELSLTSRLPRLKKGFTLVGDNAYVRTTYMAVPIKACKTEVEDSYNFYQSQLRITIERAFGVLVHRWSILRGPMNVPLFKVVPIVHCLCKLHNYCIDERLRKKENSTLVGITVDDAKHLQRLVKASDKVRLPKRSTKRKKKKKNTTVSSTVVNLDTNGTPTDLLGGGEHFNECPPRPVNDILTNCPMDRMIQEVDRQKIYRPAVN